MCEYASGPLLKWYSSTDRTNPDLGLSCTKLERVPEIGVNPWNTWYKILQALEGLP